MRKTILAVAVLAFSGVATAATVYNDNAGTSLDATTTVAGQHSFASHSNRNGQDDSYLRETVTGKYKLNENFGLIGNYAGQVNLDTHNGSRSVYGSRILNGGLSIGESTTATIGRHTGAIYNVAGFTDMAPGVLSGYSSGNDTGFMGRADNIAQLQSDLGNGVTATGQYKFAKSGDSLENSKVFVDEKAGYAGSVTADDIGGTGFGVGAAYGRVDASQGNDASQHYSVAAKYVKDGVYAAVSHTAGKNTFGQKDFRDDEVIAQYTFANGVTPSLGYIDSTVGGTTKSVETGVSYQFNKEVMGYVDAGWDTTGNGNHVGKVGLIYTY